MAWWLTGFIDGEGCFLIERHARGGYCTYSPRFQLIVREDDGPLIYGLVEWAGIGWIVERPAKGAGRPQVGWVVSKKDDTARLMAFIDRHPLRSKKCRDFAIWRRAVGAWQTMGHAAGFRGNARQDWTEMERHYIALRAARGALLNPGGPR